MLACWECGLGIWGEIALSSSGGMRTRLLSSLSLTVQLYERRPQQKTSF